MKEPTIEKAKSSYPEFDKISNDLQSLKSDVGDLLGHIKEDGLSDIADIARDQYDNLAGFGKTIESKIVKNPARSVALAFIGGIAASYLLGRR